MTRALHLSRQALPDVIALDLDVLFVGINPGLMSAAKRQHFARPGRACAVSNRASALVQFEATWV